MKRIAKNIPVIGLSLVALIVTALALYPAFNPAFLDAKGEKLPLARILTADPINGQRESCIICHGGMSGFSDSHRPEAIGCSSCHLGNPLTLDKEIAHRGMETVPGNLRSVNRTCGRQGCHAELTGKVASSLMASGRGMVSVNRFVFGETDSPDGKGHLSKLANTPADWHLDQLCRVCHLGTIKNAPEPITRLSIGGGCTACHLSYSKEAEKDLLAYKKDKTLPRVHSTLTIKPDDTRCFACHSRSSRISSSFIGWHETTLEPKDVAGRTDHVVDLDGRVFAKMPADIHHEKGLSCVDCHTARDTMGDGKEYLHQDEQVEISCTDCHSNHSPKTMPLGRVDDDSKKILELRKIKDPSRRYILTERRGQPLVNVYLDGDGNRVLESKDTGKLHSMKKPLPVCTSAISGHERLTCKSCHTAWSPTCIACHTGRDADVSRLQMLLKGKSSQPWKEQVGEFLAVPPTMGIRHDRVEKKEVIDTFIPGMILTIDNIREQFDYRGRTKSIGGNNWQVFRRLYAPTSSHTVSRKGRSCESCHSDPRALGYGSGKLTYTGDRSFPWKLAPHYAPHPVDGLPLDAWIRPGTDGPGEYAATRTGARPLNTGEQLSILRVGRCLQCHPTTGGTVNPIYADFKRSLQNRKPACGND